MKKIICIMLTLLFLFAVLTGCGATLPSAIKAKTASSDEPSEKSNGKGFFDSKETESSSEKPSEPSVETASSVPAQNQKGAIAASYERYSTAKTDGFKRFEEKLKSNTELAMLGLTYLSVVMIDLELIPLTIIDSDEAAAAIALGILGKENVKLGKENGKNVLSYTDKDGKAFKFVAEYDAATDSVQSSVLDANGAEVAFYEYVKVGNGYAFQYFGVTENGNDLISGFFDATNITGFSVQKADAKPASIFKNSSITEDFAKKGEAFIFIKDGKMLVHDSGADKTY